MNEKMRYLLFLFINIRKKEYIKNISKKKNGAGNTLEKCLKKPGDNTPFPDFYGIELKVKSKTSKYKIRLTCIEPDYMFDTYKLVTKYGYLPKNKTIKYFYLEVNSIEKIQYIKHGFQLYIDEINEVIVLNIFNYKNKIIDNSINWSFSYIKTRLFIKLNTLALVHYAMKKIDNEEYYKYYSLEFYQNLNFNKFIQALKEGIITINFTININIETNKITNHGTAFSIKDTDIYKIYDNKY